MRGPEWSELGVAASSGGPELLAVRVVQLETGVEPRPEAAGTMRLALSLVGVALLVVAFLASLSSFGGPSAVRHVTGAGLASATLLGGLSCAAPLAIAGPLAYALVAVRAGRPLRCGGSWGPGRSVLGL